MREQWTDERTDEETKEWTNGGKGRNEGGNEWVGNEEMGEQANRRALKT